MGAGTSFHGWVGGGGRPPGRRKASKGPWGGWSPWQRLRPTDAPVGGREEGAWEYLVGTWAEFTPSDYLRNLEGWPGTQPDPEGFEQICA